MKNTKTYENFPFWMVLSVNLFAILIYAMGAFVLSGFGIMVPLLYLLFCIFIEVRVLKISCIDCYYYGKFCCFGKGKLSSLFFKKGDPKRFLEKKITWISILPDFFVAIFPIVGGIVLLIRDFNYILLSVLMILVVLFFGGTGFFRGSLACKYCRQREIGCPAEQLFNK